MSLFGSHNDLLAEKGGKYSELWNAQTKHSIKDEAPA